MKLFINNQEILPPTCWNDLSTEQVLNCYVLLMSNSSLEEEEVLHDKRIRLMMYLLQLKENFFVEREQQLKEDFPEEHETILLTEVQELLACTNFFFKDEDGHKSIDLGLTKCPYPILKYKRKKISRGKILIAPSDGLENISFYELCTSFALYESYLETNNIDTVDQLLATIYRPQKQATKQNKQSDYNGDKRMPLLHHEGMVKKRIKKIKELDPLVKKVLLFWFASCREQIINHFQDLFSNNTNTKDQYGYAGLLMAVAGSMVDIDQVASKSAIDVLTYVEYTKAQREAQEEAMRDKK